MKRLAGQFARFASVGAIATACHYAVLIGLVTSGAMTPVPASAAGAAVGALVSYHLNRRFTFGSGRSHAKALPRFLVVAALAFALNLALMLVLYGGLALPYLIAQVITTGAILAVTFTLNRSWSFGASSSQSDQGEP